MYYTQLSPVNLVKGQENHHHQRGQWSAHNSIPGHLLGSSTYDVTVTMTMKKCINGYMDFIQMMIGFLSELEIRSNVRTLLDGAGKYLEVILFF